MCEKWLPAKTVRVIVPPAESLSRKHNHADRLGSKSFIMYNGLGRKKKDLDRKQNNADSLGGSQIRRKSWQKAKIGKLVYTLWNIMFASMEKKP